MSKKIVMLLFLMLVLISVSAVSAVDADDNNDTIVSSADAEALAIENDVNAIDDLSENVVDGGDEALADDAASGAVGKNDGNDLLSMDNNENGNVLTAAPKTYYVNASAVSGGTGSQTAPYQTLNAALNVAENGDTIMIAAGEYKGSDNTGLSIWRNLNFIKYGESEAIFDAEGQGRIWTVMGMSANIIGLTFKNGKSTSNGGAIYMRGGNLINCTFIDNNITGDYGGAIYCLYYTNVTNCNFTGNNARYMGGAFYTMRGGNVSDCIFTGNKVTYWGGAIGLETADNTEGTVTNCAFFNNAATHGKAISSSRVLKSIENNWWGSNNPNWNELIDTAGIPSSYAILNGSADSETIKPGSKAKLTYGFYSNATGDLLSIPSRPIELSATGGHLDDDAGYLVNGEFSTEFSSDALGEFEITATVDNQEVKLTETVAATVWYVNATAASGGDGKTKETAFQSLKEALDVADDCDIIMIASGTYTGNGNRGLSIDKKLSFEKYGDGEAIFDAQGQDRFWLVQYGVETININGLTFKNGKASYGGAIRINNGLSNSVINATFINNTATTYGGAVYLASSGDNVNISGEFRNNNAKRGGAIYIYGQLTNVNISGEFRNNEADYGGAVLFNGQVSSSNINAVFINNTALSGGAVVFMKLTTNVNITGDFINNTATGSNQEGGGANYFNKEVINVSISGNFIGNRAEGSADSDGGAANYFLEASTNVDITGKFINNTGKNVIYFTSANTGNVIHDSIFINNDAGTIFKINGSSTIYNNWFGNTADDYNITPAGVGDVKMINWLFLNATADPSEIGLGSSSTVTFDLYYVNFGTINKYDGPIDIRLDLTQTLGELDKTSASLGEEITYTAKDMGDASVTATFETASYTINLKNSGIPTVLELSVTALEEYDPSSTVVITGTVKNNMTGDIIKKGSVKLYLNGENVENITVDVDDGSISASLGVLDAGNYTVKAVYHDDTEEFGDCEWNSTFEIKKAATEITVSNSTVELILGDGLNVGAVLSPSDIGNLTYSSNDTSVVSVDEYGNVTSVSAGTAVIAVSFAGNKNYAAAEKTVNVTVKLLDANWTYIDITTGKEKELHGAIVGLPWNYAPTCYVKDGEGTGLPAGTNITIFCEGNQNYTLKAVVQDNGLFTVNVSDVALGRYSVTFSAGKAYKTANANILVVKAFTNITVDNATVSLIAGDEVGSGATLTPAEAGNLTYTVSDPSVVKVEDGKIIALAEGNATITVSFAENELYFAAADKIINVTVKLLDANWTYIDITTGKEEELHGAIVGLPWNYAPTCYVRDANGTGLPAGTNVTIFCEGNQNYTLKAVVQDNGLFTVNVSDVALGRYSVTFSVGKAYKTATATIWVVKAFTNITVDNATVSLIAGDEVGSGASLSPAEAGNLTYTVSDSSVVKVEDGKIIALAKGNATITVSFAGNDMYFAADENKTITVNVSLNDASVSVENATLDLKVGDNYAINATTVPAGLNVNYTSSNESVVIVDKNGTVTAIGEGNASITVEVGDDKVFAINSTTVNVTVSKVLTEIIIAADSLDLKVLENFTAGAALIPADAGNLTYTSSNPDVAIVENGTIRAVGLGNATITVSFAGDDKYAAAENRTINVTVSLNDVIINVKNSTVELVFGNSFAINATTVPEGLNLTYVVDDSGVISVDENGTVTTLKLGRANILVKFDGNDIYAANSTVVTVKVKVNKIEIPPEVAFNFTSTENGTEVILVNLPEDATGFVLLDINGTQTHVELVNGKANVTIPKLAEGTYNATVTYTGDDWYAQVSATKEINVTSNVPESALSIPGTSKSDAPTTYSISLPSDAGGFLEVEVDGKLYSAPLSNGSASVTIPALSDGSHNVTVRYTGDEKYSPVTQQTTLNVSAPAFKLSNNKDVSALYSAKATYKVLVTREGKAVGADEKVTFTYNGKTYTVRTDKNGYATLNLNTKVKVKKYTITAEYKGVKVTNKVTIKHIIKASNKKVKKSKKVTKVKVSLKKVNGKYIKDVVLKIKFKGKTYKVITNKKGVATWKVKKSMVKKLKKGKKYKYTVTYGKDKLTKKLTIKK